MSAARRIAALLLAAGRSSRMGGPNKLIQLLDGKSLVRHAAEALAAAGLAPIVVVTGHEPAAIAAALEGLPVTFCPNPRYAEGLSTSLRAGLEALEGPRPDAVLVALADMPRVQPAHIKALVQAFEPGAICVPTYDGKQGNPVLWDSIFIEAMKSMTGDVGAKALLARHAAAVIPVAMDDEAVLTDVDTPAMLAALASEPRTQSFEDLYPRAILRLAAAAHGAGRLPSPDVSVTRVNPTCGDRIDLDVVVKDEQIAALGYDATACVLCQASASALAAAATGEARPALVRLRAQVAAMLMAEGPDPAPPFGSFATLRPVSVQKSRHACVLLPLDALLEALGEEG